MGLLSRAPLLLILLGSLFLGEVGFCEKEATEEKGEGALTSSAQPPVSSSGVSAPPAPPALPPSGAPSAVKGVRKRGSQIANSPSAGASSSTEQTGNLFDDEKGFLAGLDYPELQVVPRASERLQMEAQEERSSFMSNYWPVQISAIALVLAGTTASGQYKQGDPSDSQKKENQFASQMGVLVGGVWLGTTYYLSHYLSYGKALPEIKKVAGKDKKSLLLRERLAEEALERPAKIAAMVNNLSVWSTLTLALYINSHSRQSLPSYAGLALGLSFLPWLIDNRIIANWQKHQEYKRKIYAPITRLDFTFDPSTLRPMPVLGFQWTF